MLPTTDKTEAVFSEASTNWNLEKLYSDLACAERKSLTPLEKTFLRGLLCGYTPAEISERVYRKRDANSVRVSLSRGLYRYIEKLLDRPNNTTIKLSGKCIPHLLKEAGYKLLLAAATQPNYPLVEPNPTQTDLVASATKYEHWDDAIDVDRISEFLNQDKVILGKTHEFLDQEFNRLSNLEKKLMYWLILERNPGLLAEMPDRVLSLISQQEFIEAVESGSSVLSVLKCYNSAEQ
ncbi:hypothetical protein [Argonema galeatum]|uniref:hypothetical protein n=1 Tax=Argonema galeatum TaxID=2942762 RepID=UPI002013966D|nr:hypothetical protein [Argonema galeatum]MCL1467056.1 hypothetical protein [Argonema galeatum A003/A1]